DDFSGAASHAQQHAGSSGDSDLFSSALGMLSGKHQQAQNEGFDEDEAVRQHQQFYGDGGSGGAPANSHSIGGAAAMQALKMFNQGGSGGGSGGGQNAFIGMAMGQAAKLFDQQSSQGNVQDGASKQNAVASAAQMALKMYMKSEMGGGSSGGGSGGGLGGLLNMASKFMK
ncbi:uncharacterized protein MYCFIDRAFT_7763, partial [Pseudocercospora fijiensis CIRAD86]